MLKRPSAIARVHHAWRRTVSLLYITRDGASCRTSCPRLQGHSMAPVPVGNSNSKHIDGVARPRSATNAHALFGPRHAEPACPSAAIGAFRPRCRMFGTMRERGEDSARQRRRLIKTFPSGRAEQPSAYPFCQGDRAETGRSRMPMARMRRMKAAPYAPSRSGAHTPQVTTRGNELTTWE